MSELEQPEEKKAPKKLSIPQAKPLEKKQPASPVDQEDTIVNDTPIDYHAPLTEREKLAIEACKNWIRCYLVGFRRENVVQVHKTLDSTKEFLASVDINMDQLAKELAVEVQYPDVVRLF